MRNRGVDRRCDQSDVDGVRYGLDMATWDARIEVVRGETRLGWTHIRDVVTETLPRVGERVSFAEDTASAELLRLIALGVPDMAQVTQVEYLVGRASSEVVVTIRARVAPYLQGAALDELRSIKEGWLPGTSTTE